MPGTYEYTCQMGAATDSDTGEACTDGYYGATYVFRDGTWWTLRTYCMTEEECYRPEGPPLDEYSYLPCIPRLTTEGIVLECEPNDLVQTWNVRAEVNTACPVNEVLRAPYPRTLVNITTTFILEPHEYNAIEGLSSDPQSPANLIWFIDEYGNPTEEGYAAGVWKDLRLIMRSRRFNGGETWFSTTVPRPHWTFTDREWNAGASPAEQEGPQATYIYRTSSSGLDTQFGRAFDFDNRVPADDFTLPAYGVSLATYCGHEWKVTLSLVERYWQASGPCYATQLFPDGTTLEPFGTSNEGCQPGWVAPGAWAYRWKDYATDWAGIDLTQIGRATPYDTRTRTQAGGFFGGVKYWDEPVGIWVPVVEVQSVIRSECVAEGLCEPPAAEPGSLAP
jgi:hypothetical protein